jgi:hypothetical protein
MLLSAVASAQQKPTTPALADNWNQFRGANIDGVAIEAAVRG